MRIPSDYTALITPLNQKPNFLAVVNAFVTPGAAAAAFLDSLLAGFSLASAVGPQLDAVGLWIGVTRIVPNPVANSYFTWGSSTLGWGAAPWKGPFDPTNGQTALSDQLYQAMLQVKVLANKWNGTVIGMQAGMAPILALTPGVTLNIVDNLNMTFSVTATGVCSPILQELLGICAAMFRNSTVSQTFTYVA